MNEQYSMEVLPCPFTSHIPVTLEITSNFVIHVRGEKGVGRAAWDNPVNCCLVFLLNVILAAGVCWVPLIAHDSDRAALVLAQSAVEHFGQGFPNWGQLMGSRECPQEPTASAGAANGTWVWPGDYWHSPHPLPYLGLDTAIQGIMSRDSYEIPAIL